MIRGVVFDLFGTLLRLTSDRKPYLRLARLLRPENPAPLLRLSLIVDAPDLPTFVSRAGEPAPAALPDLGRDLREDVRSAALFEDTSGTLHQLLSAGLKMGLISNLAAPYKACFLDSKLPRYFDAVRFSCDFGACKPSPAIFLAMSRDLEIPPHELVMVGDGVRSDVIGAKGVGMTAFLLRRHVDHPSIDSISTLADLPARISAGPPPAKS